MPIFDIKEKEGVWFEMDGGGRVKLKTVGVEKYLHIVATTTKQVPFVHESNGNVKVLTYEVQDQELYVRMVNDETIQEWEDFFDKDKKPIPCTLDNKILLKVRSETFRNFVDQKLELLEKAEKEQTEALEKNL